ncbi:hypothetical protein JZ751_015178 [Albula glossodonta]|uniref:Uncharacterized protein n=1 Tax=Albula glossodonta TaxID=121402 RepID=A0A8T2NZZ2_9TELE|nr:hypothetical protein JZ751_015178 [Albula glossodonta]
MGLMGPLETMSQNTMREILDVNLMGTIRTIQTFMPGMKARRSGRILVTGSIGGLQGLPFNEVYCASKFAVEGVCESLAILLQHFNIQWVTRLCETAHLTPATGRKLCPVLPVHIVLYLCRVACTCRFSHVSLIECGPVNTHFLSNLQQADPRDALLLQVDQLTRQLYDMYLKHCANVFISAAQEAQDIVQVFLEAISSPSPSLRYYTNSALLPLTSLKLAMHDGSQYIRAMSKFIFSPASAEDA